MSKLVLNKEDIAKAVRQYYSDYQPALYKRFDFDEPMNLKITEDGFLIEIEEQS